MPRDATSGNPMAYQQILFLLILAGGLYLFVSERLRVDVTAMLVLLALVLTGVLDADQALSGFASEPAIIVAAVFVISGALAATFRGASSGRSGSLSSSMRQLPSSDSRRFRPATVRSSAAPGRRRR